MNIMRLLVLILFFIPRISSAAAIPATSAVTYDFMCSGRIGDKLMLYWKAKAFAHAYNVPFLYKPMPRGGNQFLFDQIERCRFNSTILKQFKRIVCVTKHYSFPPALDPNKKTLYIIMPSANIDSLFKRPSFDQKKFKTYFKNMLTPVIKVRDVFRPRNKLSVALHIRTGGGYDKPRHFKQYPLKFPPFTYYVSQIKKLWIMTGDKPLYIHVFTDDENPEKLVRKLKEALEGLPLTFATRLKGNAHNVNVLDDMFAMAKFDCLIRPQSNFSQIAALLGNHKIVLAPKITSQKLWQL